MGNDAVGCQFFTRAVDALSDIHGERAVNQADLNDLICAAAKLEDAFKRCPMLPNTYRCGERGIARGEDCSQGHGQIERDSDEGRNAQ